MTAVIKAELEITIQNAQKLPEGEDVRNFEQDLEDLVRLPGLLESKAHIVTMVLA